MNAQQLNFLALANTARECAGIANSVSGTMAWIVQHWNLCCQQAGLVNFTTEARYTRRAHLAADMERMAAQLDNLAKGCDALTGEAEVVEVEADVVADAAHVETVLAEEFEAVAVRAVRRGGAFAEYWATVTDMNIVEAAQEWEQLYVEALAMDAARVAPVSNYDLKIPACSADVADAVAAQQAPTLADLIKPVKRRKRRKPAVTVASINNGRYTWRVKIGERVYLYVEGDSQAQQRIQGQRGHSYKDVKSVYMLHQIKQAIAASLPKRRFRA